MRKGKKKKKKDRKTKENEVITVMDRTASVWVKLKSPNQVTLA
jgi:hypothetical protein